ncbi:MAG TPA: diguanylate cyclase [Chloroflexota bacterium]|nr:diguanylate cyclase [Chloroflexota bacterium]
MGKGKPKVTAWIVAVTVSAVLATALTFGTGTYGVEAFLAVVVLALCAAIAHWFPIRSAADGVSYKLTNVFVLAGAIIAPAGLLPVLVALATTPELWQRRHRPRVLIGWIFNLSQTLLAAQFAGLWAHWLGGQHLDDVVDLAGLLGSAVLFNAAQAVLVGVIIALDSGIPFRRVPTLSQTALFGDGLTGVLGVTIAGLWGAKPVLLVSLPVVLIIAHRMTRTAHLAELAQVDTKTGLHNSRHFESALEEELAHSVRVRRPLSLLFADLDHFKKVNDQYGHAAGDMVLRALSVLLTSSVRKGDIVARFGGEEFVVLLPGTDAEEAGYLAERIRAAVEAHQFEIDDGRTIHCTVSIGVACCPQDGRDVASLLKAADMAMYRAKQTRNAVGCASDESAGAEGPAASTPHAAGALGHRPTVGGAVAAGNRAVAAHAGQSDRPVSSSLTVAPNPPPLAPRPKSRLAPVMLWLTVLSGLAVLGWAFVELTISAEWLGLLPFVALAIAAELLKIQVYEASKQRLSLSFSNAAVLAGVTAAPYIAIPVGLVAGVMHVLVGRQRQADKVLFNLTNLPLAAAAAALVYAALRPAGSEYGAWHVAAALAATLVYYVANVGVVSVMISLHSGRRPTEVFRELVWFAPTNILLGLTGAFVGGAHDQLGIVGVVMFIVPVLVMRFTLSFYATRTQRHIETLQAAKTEVEAANNEKEEMLRKLIETVALIIDARDNSVSGHSRRVAKFSVAIGRELAMDPAELAVLHTAGLFHDLGKVGIPEAILHKPAKLTADEYTVIKEHAALGQRILSEVPQLADIAQMVGEHHERFDGFGYPLGLAGEKISLGGRILVVADAFETMLADRPYSRGRELGEAIDELDRCSGSHFDPEIVSAVHRAVASQGPDFFAGGERHGERNWGAAEQILAQVFA